MQNTLSPQTQTTLEVGKKLVEMCRQNKHQEAHTQLYDANIVSVEPFAPPGQSREVKGLAACQKKGEEWNKAVQVNSAKVEGPFLHGENQFAVYFDYDVTFKQKNQKGKMTEVGIYTVKNGKVVHEAFYYTMDPAMCG